VLLGLTLKYASEKLKGDKEIVLDAVQRNSFILQYATEELRGDREVVLTAIQQYEGALKYASKELKEDKKFLIECYRKNNDIRKYNDFLKEFIEEFDKLENGHFDDTFIEDNVDILHLVENKEQLCQYLLDNEKYKIIHENEVIAEYIKDKYKVIILSYGIIDPENEHDRDELENEHKNINIGFQVIFIL